MSEEVRRYGFFKCDSCRRRWESANVYCKKDSFEALYGQECSRCAEAGNDDVMVFPYRVERLKCPRCGSNAGCSCFEESSEDDSDDDARHNDPTKAHRSDLCGRCLSGKPCRHT
ncbi:zygote arrest protein 1-like isoform X1 [Amphiura filiformis]|uniref:zygote arrest protein 1-like isoform X1 n=1 Tax=Amphiura filiformis TaxID=82378 RepID=UPI003B20EC2C